MAPKPAFTRRSTPFLNTTVPSDLLVEQVLYVVTSTFGYHRAPDIEAGQTS